MLFVLLASAFKCPFVFESLKAAQRQIASLISALMMPDSSFLQTDAASNDDSADDSDSFTGRLISKILANMQVIVRRIHVRFEDFSSPECPRAIGICISELSGSYFDCLCPYLRVSSHQLVALVVGIVIVIATFVVIRSQSL